MNGTTKQTPKKVTLLLRELAPAERQKLLDKLGVGRATYFRWQKQPGVIPVEKAEVIRDFLQQAYGERYDLLDLWQPVKRKAKAA